MGRRFGAGRRAGRRGLSDQPAGRERHADLQPRPRRQTAVSSSPGTSAARPRAARPNLSRRRGLRDSGSPLRRRSPPSHRRIRREPGGRPQQSGAGGGCRGRAWLFRRHLEQLPASQQLPDRDPTVQPTERAGTAPSRRPPSAPALRAQPSPWARMDSWSPSPARSATASSRAAARAPRKGSTPGGSIFERGLGRTRP